MKWRQGRTVGRTIYRQMGDEESVKDELIGVMDSRELAAIVVTAVNADSTDIRALKAELNERERARAQLAEDNKKLRRELEDEYQRGYREGYQKHMEGDK